MQSAPTSTDIKEFEEKVVKTFCEEYFRKAFTFLFYERSKLDDIDSIERLVEFILESKVCYEFFLFEEWLSNSFQGLETAINKCLIAYHPIKRRSYSKDPEIRKKITWLFEAICQQHQALVEKHLYTREINEFTGDYPPDPCLQQDEYHEYLSSMEKSINADLYTQKLEAIKIEGNSGLIEGTTDIELNDEVVTDDAIEKMQEYFKVNGVKPDDLCYRNNSPMELDTKTVPMDGINKALAKIAQEVNPQDPAIKAYALYLYTNDRSFTKKIAAEQCQVSPNSLDGKAERNLMKKVYLALKKIGY